DLRVADPGLGSGCQRPGQHLLHQPLVPADRSDAEPQALRLGHTDPRPPFTTHAVTPVSPLIEESSPSSRYSSTCPILSRLVRSLRMFSGLRPTGSGTRSTIRSP